MLGAVVIGFEPNSSAHHRQCRLHCNGDIVLVEIALNGFKGGRSSPSARYAILSGIDSVESWT